MVQLSVALIAEYELCRWDLRARLYRWALLGVRAVGLVALGTALYLVLADGKGNYDLYYELLTGGNPLRSVLVLGFALAVLRSYLSWVGQQG